ncbi:A-kinase anchor protein 9 [Octopus bimaculoides]|uniref:A-kinase anchor protein 9 n=1 Tax=Octopus bimaculoides TaxID=37653 RepID=UPI00071DA45D|nr:A-kinase anchor protein 9 [Octopus bimaculoides]|eukprot:XP_014773033.1 PREDICTED: golgin subfamily B member 1-like [Octopus bimaculoides]
MAGSSNDLQMQCEENEKLVQQLRLMIVEKDNIIEKTQSELQETKAALTKTKLQSKAKTTKLTNQLEEAKKAALPDSSSDRGSECGDESPAEQVSRGKIKLLRRKLVEKERLLAEKEGQLVNHGEEMLAKDKTLVDRDQTIKQLKEMINTLNSQLVDRDKIIRDINESENPSAKSQETLDQIYVQILSKDKKIVDLNNSIIELDSKIKDLQEFIGEKNEVIKGRDKVIGGNQGSNEVEELKNRLAEAEEDKGNLLLQLGLMCCLKVQNMNPFADGEIVVAHSVEDKLLLSELQQKCSELSENLRLEMEKTSNMEAGLLNGQIEIEGLKAQIHASDAAVEQLQKHLVDRSELATKLEGEKVGLEIRNSELEDIKDEQPNIAFEEENSRLQLMIQELQNQLVSQDDVSKKQKQEINDLISKLQSMESAKDESLSNVDQMMESLKKAKAETDEELKKTQTSLDETQMKLQQTEDALQTVVSEHGKAQKELQQSLDETLSNFQQQSQEIGHICHFLGITEISVEKLFYVVKEKAECVTELQQRLEIIEKSQDEKQNAFESKETELESLKSQLQDYNKNVQLSMHDRAAENNSYKENLSMKDQNIKLLQETIDTQTAEICKFKELQVSQEQKEKGASEKLQEFLSQTALFQSQIEALQKDAESKQRSLSESEAKVESLQQSLQEKVEEFTKVVSVQSRMDEDSGKIMAEKQAQLENLKSSLDQMTNFLNEKQFEFDSKREEMNSVVLQLNTEKTEKDAQIESLSVKVSELTASFNESKVFCEKVQAEKVAHERTMQVSGEMVKDLLINRLGTLSTDSEMEMPLSETIGLVISQIEGLLSEKVRLESMLQHSEKNNESLKSNIEELENKCSQNELTLMSLQSDSSQQELAVKKLMEEKDVKITSLQDNVESLNLSLQQSQLHENDLTQQIKNVQDSSNFMQQQLTDAKNQVEALTQQQTSLQEELRLLKDQEISRETNRQDLEILLEEQGKKVRLLSENLELVSHEKKCMHAEVENGIREIQLVTNTNLELTRKIGQLQDLLSEKEGLVQHYSDELEKEKSQLNVHLEKCSNQINDLEQALASSNSKLSEVSASNLTFEKSLTEHKDRVEWLEVENNQLLLKLSEYDNNQLLLHEKEQVLARDNEDIVGKLVKAEQVMSEREGTIGELETNLKNAEDKIKENNAMLQEACWEKKDLEDKLKELGNRLEVEKELRVNIETVNKNIKESFEDYHQKTVQELQEQSSLITSSNKAAEKQREENLSLSNKLSSLQSRFDNQLAERNHCIIGLEEQLQKSVANENRLVKEIELLQSEKHEAEMDIVNFKVSLQEKEDLIRNLLLSVDETKEFQEVSKEKFQMLLQENQFYEQVIKDLQSELKDSKELGVTSEKSLEKMKNSVKEGEVAVESFRKSYENLKQEHDILCQKLKESEYNLEEKNLELSRFQGVLHDSQLALEDSFEKVKKESELTITDLINKNQVLTTEISNLRLQIDEGNKSQEMVGRLKKELVEKSKECAQLKTKISSNEEDCSEMNQLIDACLLNNYGKESLPEPLPPRLQSSGMPFKNVKKQTPNSNVDGALKKKPAKKSTRKSKSTSSLNNGNTAADSSERHNESDISLKEECGNKIIIKKLKELVQERENLFSLLDSLNSNFEKDALKEESIPGQINQFCKYLQEQKLMLEDLQQMQTDRELAFGSAAKQLTEIYENCACILVNGSEQMPSQDSDFIVCSNDKSENNQLENLVDKFSNLFHVLQTWKETHVSILDVNTRETSGKCSEEKVVTQDPSQSQFVVEKERVLAIEESAQIGSKKDPNISRVSEEILHNTAPMQKTILNFFAKCQQIGINVTPPATVNKGNLSEEDILEASLNALFDRVACLGKESQDLKAFVQALEGSSQDQVLELIKRKDQFIGDPKLTDSVLNVNSLVEFDEEKIKLEKNGRLVKEKDELQTRLIEVLKEKEMLECQMDEVELLRITIRKLEEDLKKKLVEKDRVAEQLAKVDMELVSTCQERDKVKNHLEQVLREHKKCLDIESRLEKVLRDKQVLSQKVMDMESKISQMKIDKERMKKQLAGTKPKTEKNTPLLKRRTRSQEIGDKKVNKNPEDVKRKSSLTKKTTEKGLSTMSASRYGSVESVRSEILRVGSPTLSEKSYGTSDSCASEMCLRDELMELRSKTDAYSKHFEELKMFWRNDICKTLSEILSPDVSLIKEPNEAEINEKVSENAELIAIKVENIKTEMSEVLTKIGNWKSSFSEIKTSEKEPAKERYLDETPDVKDTEVENKPKRDESVARNEVPDLCNKNERLKQMCVKLKKSYHQSNAEIEALKNQLETVNSKAVRLDEQLKEKEIKINDFEILVTELKDGLDVKTAEILELNSTADSKQLSLEDGMKQLQMTLSARNEELCATRNCCETIQESFSLLVKEILELVSQNQFHKPEADSSQNHFKQLFEDLGSGLFQSLDECQQKSFKTAEALETVSRFLSQYQRYQQEIFIVFGSFMSCLKEIQNDIKEESLKANTKSHDAVLEDLNKIVNNSNYLEHSTSTEEQVDLVKPKPEMCPLDDSDTQTGVNFLNWLRGYLKDLALSRDADNARFLDIVSELNVVVLSKEEAIQKMSETMEALSSERKKLVKEVARLQNACDDSHSTAVSHSEETKRVKNSLDALESRISGLLTYVKDVHGSTLETIMEESEEEEECHDDVTDGLVNKLAGSTANLDNLQSLEKHFAAFAAAYSHVANVCNNQGSEIEKLRSLLTKQQELSVKCPEEMSSISGSQNVSELDGSNHPVLTQNLDTTRDTQPTPQHTSVELDKISLELDEVKQEKLQVDQQLVSVQKQNEELQTKWTDLVTANQEMQSYMQNVQHEMQQVKLELRSTDEHSKLKDLQIQELSSQVEEKSAEINKLSTHLQETERNLDLVNKSLVEKDTHVNELKELLERKNKQQQENDSVEEQNKQDVLLLKEQLSVREQQLQHLTLEIAENMKMHEEQQGRLKEKDEKIMSLLENMQELEEQLTSSFNTKEGSEGKIAELEDALQKEKEALDSTKKSLQNKENQYLKVLATAKKLKLQVQEAKNESKLGKDEMKETNAKVFEEINSMNSFFQQKVSLVLSEWPELAEVEGKDIGGAKLFEKRMEESGSVGTEPCKATLSLLQKLMSTLEAAKHVVVESQQENQTLKQLSYEQEVLLSDFNQKQELLLSQNLEKEDLLAIIEEKNQKMLELQDRVYEVEQSLKTMETETEKDVRITFLNGQLDESGRTIHLLQEEITNKNKELEDNKLNASKWEQKLMELTDQDDHRLKEMTLKMQELSAEINAKNACIEEQSLLLKASEEKMVGVGNEISEKETVISELKNALDDVSKQNQHTVEELKKLKEMYNQTVEELQLNKEEINSKDVLLKQIQNQLEAVSNEVQQKEQLIVEYKEELEYLRERESERAASDLEPDLRILYEKLKAESGRMSLEKEQLTSEWKESINENNRLNAELQKSDSKRKALEESLNVSHENIAKMEEDIEKFTEDLLQSSKEKTVLSENLEQLKKENSMLKEKCNPASSETYSVEVPLEPNLVKEHQGSLYSARIEKESIQRSEVKNPSESLLIEKELHDVQERFESLSREHETLKNKHQITTEKCEKLLVKLKSFKDKNDNLLKEMENLKIQKVGEESKVIQLQNDLHSEKVKYQELSVFCQQGQKSQSEAAEKLAEFENNKKENEKVNQKLSKSNSELQSKCEKLSKQIENVLSEKSDFENKWISLKQEMETASNQYSVEKSTLLNKIANLEGECKNVYADLEDFQQLVKKQKESQDNLKSENHKLRESVSKYEKELLNSSIAKDHCSQVEIQLQGLSEERDNLKDQVDAAREEVVSHRKEVQTLRKQFEEAKNKMSQEQEMLVAELEKTKRESDERDGLAKNDLEVRLSNVEKELEAKVCEIIHLKDENQMLLEKMKNEMNERELYKREAREAGAIEEQLRESQKREGVLEQEKMFLEENFQAVKMELEANKEMLRQNMKEIEELTAEVNRLTKEISSREVWKRQLEEAELEVSRKEESLSLLKNEVDILNEQIERLTAEGHDLENTCQSVDGLKKENSKLTTELQQIVLQNKELVSSKEELSVVNERYNKLLMDNTHLAKQFEELRNKMQTQVEKEQSFAHEQQEHLKREQVTFTKRVEELEDHVQELTNQNTQLKQDMVQVNSSLKEAHFENESLKSQLQVIQNGGDRLNQFQEEYQKLQEQFSKSIEQNNSVQAELNQANHRLQLRESRCQQLAMQVSQLAEDRSYLNVQMGNLSLALREKEKESSSLAHQIKDSYEKQTKLQQRSLTLWEFASHSLAIVITELEEHQEELMSTSVDQATKFVAERNQRLQVEILLQQSQQQLSSLREKMQQDFKIEMDDDPDRILQAEPLLVRQGSNYCHRIQRWMKVKKEYFCFSSRHLQRLLRFRPNLRSIIWFYFLLLHTVVIACFAGYL